MIPGSSLYVKVLFFSSLNLVFASKIKEERELVCGSKGLMRCVKESERER